ncbi:MAG: hypothetical protein ACE5H9_14100 [Anaerolineae bacterium]
MLYLVLCIIGSAVVSVILKVYEAQDRNRLVIIASNYLVATILSGIWWTLGSGGSLRLSAMTLLLGLGAGLLYALGFFLFMATTRRHGLAKPVTFMRLSVALPVLTSIFLWQEQPTLGQMAGLALTGLALWLLSSVQLSSPSLSKASSWSLVVLGGGLFLVIGLADTLAKAFEAGQLPGERGGFLFVTFGAAFVASVGLILARRVPVCRADFIAGLGLGLPNQLAVLFLLLALAHLPAIVVFPTLNVSLVLLSTLLGYLIWRERLNAHGTVGVAVTALALILINV